MLKTRSSAPPVVPAAPDSDQDDLGEDGSLVVEDHTFAIIPDWVINADISDAAFRVYSLLLRFGGTSGCRMPSRGLLARRLHSSTDSIDRALRELVDHALVRIEHRHNGRKTLSNRYHVRTSPPTSASTNGTGRRSAAPPPTNPDRGRTFAAPRKTAAPPAADLRHNPDVLTKTTPPPPAPTSTKSAGRWRTPEETAEPDVLAFCGIDDLAQLSRRCVATRAALGQPPARWSPQCLAIAIRLAVINRGWPAATVVTALLAVAADAATRSPARLAEAGPWWDHTDTATTNPDEPVGVDADLESRLAELDGRRPHVQARARAELASEGLPLTRGTVTRRAADILHRTPAPS